MRFETVARLRPVSIVRPVVEAAGPLPQAAPYCSVVARTRGPVTLTLSSGPVVLEGVMDRRASLRVTAGGETTVHRPRRRRAGREYDAAALTLTGTHLTLLTRADGAWTGRARVDLAGRVETRSPEFLSALRVDADTGLEAGPFGQLGLRDPRVVTRADGTPYTIGGEADGTLLLTATSAGPGFFDTAHTSVWSLDLAARELSHRGDLFFRRGGLVYGDHATHLVRDGDGWLVTTSTWGDVAARSSRGGAGRGVGRNIGRGADRRAGAPLEPLVRVAIARSDDDLLTGTHVLDASPLDLPTDGPSAGVWDPHLVHDGSRWLVGYVSATQTSPRFLFHPALATGPSLDALTLRAARPDRTATEGTTILRMGSGDDAAWRVLASDGRDGPRGLRRRFPVFDLDLREVETLDADYPTNLPWPTLVRVADGWAMVTFDGSPSGGRLLGYGTHGDLVIAHSRSES